MSIADKIRAVYGVTKDEVPDHDPIGDIWAAEREIMGKTLNEMYIDILTGRKDPASAGHSFTGLRALLNGEADRIPFGTVLEDKWYPEAKMMALGLPQGENAADAIWISGPNAGAMADTRVGRVVEDTTK